MNGSEQFLFLFNRLELLMKRRLGFREEEKPSHAKLINQLAERDPVIAEHASRLHAYRSLRNSIVHIPGTGEPTPIAEPHPEVVQAFEKLVAYVETPPTALETVAIVDDLYTVTWQTPLLSSIDHMLSNSFRLAPITAEGNLVGIFTESTLWQAAKDRNGLTWMSPNTTFSDLETWCSFENAPLGIVVLPASSALHQVEQTFRERFERNEFTTAILFTDTGQPGARLAGIVTAHDLPSANPVARKRVLERLGNRL